MSGGPIARNPSPHPAGGHGFDSADDGRRSGRRHRSASAQVVGLFRQLVPHQCTPALSRALSSASLTKHRPRQHCCHSCWSKIAAKGVQRVDGLSRETWRAMVADSFSHCRLRRPRGGVPPMAAGEVHICVGVFENAGVAGWWLSTGQRWFSHGSRISELVSPVGSALTRYPEAPASAVPGGRRPPPGGADNLCWRWR